MIQHSCRKTSNQQPTSKAFMRSLDSPRLSPWSSFLDLQVLRFALLSVSRSWVDAPSVRQRHSQSYFAQAVRGPSYPPLDASAAEEHGGRHPLLGL